MALTKLTAVFAAGVLLSAYSLAAESVVGDVDRGQAKSATCVACHGSDGNSQSDAFPKIAGQHQNYLAKQLRDYQQQNRRNDVMYGMVSQLTEQDIADLSAYYAAQEASVNVAKMDAEQFKLAEQLYRGGKLAVNMAACSACHGANGQGIDSANFPALSFQYAAYTAQQLYNFRQNAFDEQTNSISANARSNDPSKMMRDVAKHLTNEEIEALAQYVAGLH